MHLMAVRIAAGLNVQPTRKRTNLTALRRRARAGRKQGRKRGLDAVERFAPDSVRAKRQLSPVSEVPAEQSTVSLEESNQQSKACRRSLDFTDLQPTVEVMLISFVLYYRCRCSANNTVEQWSVVCTVQ